MNFFLMTFFFRYFNQPSPRAILLTNLSFLVFFFCPAVIVPLTMFFEPLAMPIFFKWLLTAVLSTVLSYLTAWLLYKIPFIRKIF